MFDRSVASRSRYVHFDLRLRLLHIQDLVRWHGEQCGIDEERWRIHVRLCCVGLAGVLVARSWWVDGLVRRADIYFEVATDTPNF